MAQRSRQERRDLLYLISSCFLALLPTFAQKYPRHWELQDGSCLWDYISQSPTYLTCCQTECVPPAWSPQGRLAAKWGCCKRREEGIWIVLENHRASSSGAFRLKLEIKEEILWDEGLFSSTFQYSFKHCCKTVEFWEALEVNEQFVPLVFSNIISIWSGNLHLPQQTLQALLMQAYYACFSRSERNNLNSRH